MLTSDPLCVGLVHDDGSVEFVAVDPASAAHEVFTQRTRELCRRAGIAYPDSAWRRRG